MRQTSSPFRLKSILVALLIATQSGLAMAQQYECSTIFGTTNEDSKSDCRNRALTQGLLLGLAVFAVTAAIRSGANEDQTLNFNETNPLLPNIKLAPIRKELDDIQDLGVLLEWGWR